MNAYFSLLCFCRTFNSQIVFEDSFTIVSSKLLLQPARDDSKRPRNSTNPFQPNLWKPRPYARYISKYLFYENLNLYFLIIYGKYESQRNIVTFGQRKVRASFPVRLAINLTIANLSFRWTFLFMVIGEEAPKILVNYMKELSITKAASTRRKDFGMLLF